jgi:hypothetical protein
MPLGSAAPALGRGDAQPSLQVHEKQRDRRRRDPGDARRLADRFGLVQLSLC